MQMERRIRSARAQFNFSIREGAACTARLLTSARPPEKSYSPDDDENRTLTQPRLGFKCMLIEAQESFKSLVYVYVYLPTRLKLEEYIETIMNLQMRLVDY